MRGTGKEKIIGGKLVAIRVDSISSRTRIARNRSKLRVIEDVVGFSSELERHTLSNDKALE